MKTASLIGLILAWIGFATTTLGQDLDRKASPFDGLRWQGDAPEVLLDATWYRSTSIAGVDTADILEFCERRWPGQVRKRFGEDLVEAMVLMGHEVPERVELGLVRLSDGEAVTLTDVEMSAAKRRAIRDAGAASSRPAPPPATLTREQALADLDTFADRLRDQFAYLELGEHDWEAQLESIRGDLAQDVSTGALAASLARLMAGFRDGHASVSSFHLDRAERYAPFLLQECEGGVVAFDPDRRGFVDDEHPYLLAIDGIAIETWIERAARTIPSGSRQLVRRRALRDLREFTLLREEGETSDADTVRLTLGAGAGGARVERELALERRRPTFGTWPRTRSRILEGGIGYLRLEEMDDDLVPHVYESMAAFADTRGLIVDVRGNGGGSRSLLLALGGFLVGPDEAPRVVNVARYVASERFGSDHLEARFMLRADDSRLSPAQRDAVRRIASDFEPEWESQRRFSPWHYLVLDRTGREGEYFYDRPVIVLADSWCFSATDIFLGALKDHPRVTLMGEASAGGSARSQRFTLPNSRIDVRCASMASYRPDGRLYDGRGVEVDVEVATRPTDLLEGGTDTVLDAALARLRN